MMGSLKSKRYQATAPANWQAPKRHYAGCLALCVIGALVLMAIYNYLNQPAVKEAPIRPASTAISTPIPVPTPNMPQRTMVVGKEVIAECVVISEECGSVEIQPQHHAITALEQAALNVVYPTTEPIPAGVDSACYWAKKYNVSCADVKSSTE